MSEISEWLGKQGLERYASVFEAAEIELATLALLTDDDLLQIGIPLGPRRKILSSAKLRAVNETAASVGERRQITVMFVDLVGSTKMSTVLDPEIMGDLLANYKAAIAEEVVQAGGTVAKYLGDGVLAYFGWPKAREDAAECAIHCAFHIRERIKHIADPDGVPLQCRTGIASGLVVVGGTTGSGNAREDTVAGEVLNLAARLQALAEPGGIRVSARVLELVGQTFEFDFAGNHELRGFDEPVAAWRPIRQAELNRFAAKHSVKRSLIGRDEELSSLVVRWSEMRDGKGQAVLIRGDAGIGKSRLLEELRAKVSATPHAFVCWQCSAFHQTKPLYPIIEAITRAANIFDADDGPARLGKLKALLGAAGVPVDNALPLFAALLSIPTAAGYSMPDVTPAQRRSATIAGIVDWIRHVAQEKPLLLHLEDIHWADATTLELATLLIDGLSAVPLMAVITSRSELALSASALTKVDVVDLDRLSDHDCEGLIREIIPSQNMFQSTVKQILEHSDGNPLYVEELSAGFAESRNDRQAVPHTLQGSLMARLDQLGDAKRTAQLCSVLGRQFARPLLMELYESGPAILDTNLSMLVAHDVVHPLGRADEGRYQFKHALLRDAAYESLLLSERRRLHERCARQLERSFPELAQSEPELLAHHFSHAGLIVEAADYFEQAGDRASAGAAYIEAIASYRDALGQAGKLAQEQSREQREMGILLKLGPALSIIDGAQGSSVRDVYEQAEKLGQQVNDLDGRFKALWGLWYNANVGRDYERASEFAEQLVALSEQSRNDAHVLEALHCRWSSAMFRGDCFGSIRDATRGAKLYRRDRHHRLAAAFGGHDPGVCAHGVAGSSQVTAGLFDAAMRNIMDAVDLANDLSHPHSIAHALMVGLYVAATMRDFDRVQEWASSLSEVADRYNFPPQRAVAAFFTEWSKAQTGELDLERLRSTFNEAFARGPITLVYIGLYTQELLKAGKTEEALRVIDDFVGTLKSPIGYCLPEIYRVRGECLAALGRPKEARDQLMRAGELAVAQGAELFALRAALARARLCPDGDPRHSAKADAERSIAAIGQSGSPEIIAARELCSALNDDALVSQTLMQ